MSSQNKTLNTLENRGGFGDMMDKHQRIVGKMNKVQAFEKESASSKADTMKH